MCIFFNRPIIVIYAFIVIVFSSFSANADSGLNQEFHNNVQHGYLEKIKESLQGGANVNSPDSNSLSALHEAMGNAVPLSVAQLLIAYKANLEATDSSGQTPIFLAIKNNASEKLKFLISKSARVNVADKNGNTPLHESSKPEIMDILLKSGANINSQNNKGQTPLHLAVSRRDNQSITYLLNKGASISAKDNEGLTAFSYFYAFDDFMSNNDEEIIKPFLKKATSVEMLLGTSVDAKNKYGGTLLHRAAIMGHNELIEYLLNNGASIDATDKNGYTPLFFSAWYTRTSTAKLLVDKGARLDHKTNEGESILHVVGQYDDGRENEVVGLFDYFVKAGLDVNARNIHGSTPIFMPFRKKERVEFLINSGADINIQNINGDTPLHYAARGGSVDVVHTLIKNGAKVDVLNNKKLRPIDYSFSPVISEIFISYGTGNPDVRKGSADIQRELRTVLAEGGDHLGYSRAMLNYLNKWHKTNEQKPDDASDIKYRRSPGRNINYGEFRRNSDFDYFSLLSGGVAIRESLQLDSIREIDNDDTARLAIRNLKGPEIKSHPFKQMMQGRPGKLSVLDAMVPENFYYVHAESLTKFLEFIDYLGDKGNSLYRRYDMKSIDYHLKERYLTQLALKENPQNRKYYDFVINEMVITGSDPFFRNGTDVSMIFRIKHPLIFEMMIKRYRNEFRSRFDAQRQSLNISAISVDHLFTEDRRINAFYFQLPDDVYVISNSIGAVKRIIATHLRKTKSMADADDYKYMRSLMTSSGDEELFVYLSDSFVRYLVGPELRIKEARRMHNAASLANLEKYILLYYQIYRKSPASVDALIRGLTPPGFEKEHSQLFPSSVDGTVIAPNGFNAVSREYGSVHRLIPNIENNIEYVTTTEADLYDHFVKNYHNFWRDYFDPIGISIRYDEGKLHATTHILPLINSSLYNTLVSYIGGQPVTFSSISLVPEEVMGFAFKLNAPVKNSLGEFLNLHRHKKDISKWDDFLGDYAEIYMLDAVPMVDFNAKILLDHMFQTRSSTDKVPALYVFGAWSLFHPLRLTIPIKDASLKNTFEKTLMTRLNELSVSSSHSDVETYCTLYRGKEIRTVRLGLWGAVNLRFFYLFDKDFHMTTTEDYMRRIIDNLDNIERRNSTQKTNVAFQIFPSRVKLEKDIFAANLIEGLKDSSFQNLGTMKLLHSLFPDESDLGKKAYDIFGFEPVCPAKGKYLLDEKNVVSSSLFGTPDHQFILKDEVMKKQVDEMLKTPKIEVQLKFHETGIITDIIIE